MCELPGWSMRYLYGSDGIGTEPCTDCRVASSVLCEHNDDSQLRGTAAREQLKLRGSVWNTGRWRSKCDSRCPAWYRNNIHAVRMQHRPSEQHTGELHAWVMRHTVSNTDVYANCHIDGDSDSDVDIDAN